MKKKRPHGLFWRVVMLSLAVHVAAALVFGGKILFAYVQAPSAPFAAAPAAVSVPPQQVAYRVEMQRIQKASTRVESGRRLAAKSPSPSALPAVELETPLRGPALGEAGWKAGGGAAAGWGQGLGRYGVQGGLGHGRSAINFFGAAGSGERVVFVIDATPSMVAPERGDLPGFERVKAEVLRQINRLSPATVFNVLVFERAVDAFAAHLIAASPETKRQVAEWLRPYWRLQSGRVEQRGTFRRNYRPEVNGLGLLGGGSRLDLALLAAFEMGADAIFVITDGAPSIQREMTSAERAAYEQALVRYRREKEEHERRPPDPAAEQDYQRRYAAWRERQEREQAERRARGLPPAVRESVGGGAPRRSGPKQPGTVRYLAPDAVLALLRTRAEALYGERRQRLPSVNAIGYSADPAGQRFLQRLAQAFPPGVARAIGRFEPEKK